MRFLNLIKKNHTIALPSDWFSQYSELVAVANVAGGWSNQSTDGMFLLVLAHINPYNVLRIVEQKPRQRFTQLCLSNTSSAQEH